MLLQNADGLCHHAQNLQNLRQSRSTRFRFSVNRSETKNERKNIATRLRLLTTSSDR